MHNPDETQKLISDLGQLAFNAKDALASDDIEKLGEIFNAAQTILRQLGVSCAQLDDLIALSLKNGSLGSKLTVAVKADASLPYEINWRCQRPFASPFKRWRNPNVDRTFT